MAVTPNEIYMEVTIPADEYGADFIEKRIDQILLNAKGYQTANPHSCILIAKGNFMTLSAMSGECMEEVMQEVKRRYEDAGWRMDIAPHTVTLFPVANGN